jgi:hypothetical protein
MNWVASKTLKDNSSSFHFFFFFFFLTKFVLLIKQMEFEQKFKLMYLYSFRSASFIM